MGKIKTKRQKLHIPAQSKKKNEEDNGSLDLSKIKTSLVPLGSEFPTRGLFSQTDDSSLSVSDASHFQHPHGAEIEDDRRSFVSKKSLKSGHQGQITKKQRMKMRHDKWLEKIETIEVAKRNKRDAKKRSERPIIGDLNPLNQALPELSEIMSLSQRKTQEAQKAQKKPHKDTLKIKEKRKLLLEESSRFKQVLKDSAFKSNPFAAINQHLKNKLLQEQDVPKT